MCCPSSFPSPAAALDEIEAAEKAWYNAFTNLKDMAAVNEFCTDMYAYDSVPTPLVPTPNGTLACYVGVADLPARPRIVPRALFFSTQ